MKRQKLSRRIIDRIAELARENNATGDPRADNEKVLNFIADDGGAGADWAKQSPWYPSTVRNAMVLEELSLLSWHFYETGNPLFVAVALRLPQLPPEHSAATDWVRRAVDQWAEKLMDMVDRPPKGEPRRALAEAIGFPATPNSNPFRQARNILRDDWIYCAVAEYRRIGKTIEGAAHRAGADLGVSAGRARDVYYERRSILSKDGPAWNAAKVIALSLARQKLR
jgi:hypothetical protein